MPGTPDEPTLRRREEIDVTPEMDAALDAAWERVTDTAEARADAIADILGGLDVRPGDLS